MSLTSLDDIFEKLMYTKGHIYDSSAAAHYWFLWRQRWIQPSVNLEPDNPWIGPYQDSTGYWHSGGFIKDLRGRGIDVDARAAHKNNGEPPPYFKLLRKV